MSNTYDALVIGGGHNGLVSAAYLARSGARTLVLEGRGSLGGAATTESPWEEAPHLRVTRLSYVMSLMPPTIVRELELERHGYRVHPMGPSYQAFPEGGSLIIYEDDPKRTHEQLSKFSKKDADALPEYNAWLERIADVMGPLLTQVPPNIGSKRPSDLLDLAKLAWPLRSSITPRLTADITRLLTMSIADLLDDWFESPQVKGLMAVNGIIGTWAGPYEPGTAYVMAHHSIGDVGDGQLGSWGYPEGGMGGVSEAIATVRTQLRCRDPHQRKGFPGADQRWSGPRGGAREWRRDVGTVGGHHAASEDRLPRPPFAHRTARRLRWRHRALEDAQRRGEDQRRAVRAAQLHRQPEFWNGRASHRLDRDGADDGVHRGRVPGRARRQACAAAVQRRRHPHHVGQDAESRWHAHHVAIHPVGARGVGDAPHTEELDAYADRVIDTYDQVAPGFKASITHRDVVGPYEMEQEYGLIGGNIFHGELSLEQLFHMRPAPGFADYRTPIAGLYNGSSATHAGGGVCGIPGWQAARAALADRKRSRRFRRGR